MSDVPAHDSIVGSTSLSALYGALQSSRRRRAILYVRNTATDTVTARVLGKQIASLEHDTMPENLSNEQYHRVYSNLTQYHLPELDEAGIVIYNRAGQTVEPGPNLLAATIAIEIMLPIIRQLFDSTHI